ncbi:hypothetical protein CVIRNUC_006748 [Coccomyxa viridis]|uniref:Uncharacterized protein n=1 Tax=Coccomyxa viridis TaxID=1274662 RepID=A0AAV1I911_9CHLO|nr:hypothetical protein CVIRNUC_006748 [Coccomyxa viridis]
MAREDTKGTNTQFLLLQAGKGERDDAWPGDDLMEFFQLKRLYDFSMRALDKPSAYLKGVPGDTTLYRGEGTDILPFADGLPLAQRPALQELSPREKLQQALTLRPGGATLPEAERGIVVREREPPDQQQGAKKKL